MLENQGFFYACIEEGVFNSHFWSPISAAERTVSESCIPFPMDLTEESVDVPRSE